MHVQCIVQMSHDTHVSAAYMYDKFPPIHCLCLELYCDYSKCSETGVLLSESIGIEILATIGGFGQHSRTCIDLMRMFLCGLYAMTVVCAS